MPPSNPDIAKLTGPILPGKVYSFMNNEISVHEVLEHLLCVTGPAVLFLTSFSISELGIRSLLSLIEENRILRFQCLFDHTVRKNKLPMLLFARELGEIRLTDIHAKELLLFNDQWNIVVSTSSNFNRIERHETFVIDTTLATFGSFYRYLSDLYDNAIPFEVDD